MKISCPSCGAVYEMEAAVQTAEGKRLAALLADLPPEIAKGLLSYLTLFRAPSGQLRAATMLRRAEELLPSIREGAITRGGRKIPVTPALWAEAFHHLAARPGSLRLPLKSHGYLLEVLAGLSDRMAAAAEDQREQRRRNRGSDGRAGTVSVAELLERRRRAQWDAELGLGGDS